MAGEVRVAINADADLVDARARAAPWPSALGFPAGSHPDRHRHLGGRAQHRRARRPWRDPPEAVPGGQSYGLVVIARDEGAGIRDLEAALRDEYSGRGGLGLGLSGARRLMDEFEIESTADIGTTVTMKKWRQRDELARLREERRQRG